jgi:hypothetical protein
MRVRAGSGVGDAIYLRAVCEHLARSHTGVIGCTDYSGIFAGTEIQTAPFSREKIAVCAHYTPFKIREGSTQWQDCCDTAKVGHIPFRINHEIRNTELIDKLRRFADGKPLILVHGGRTPMARSDDFGKELLPHKAAFDAVLGELQDCFLVQIGQAEQIYPLSCDISLNGSTSICDLLDLGVACDGAIGQCSYIVPLAEVFDKPLLAVWAAHGMQYNMHPYVRAITPQKVLSKPSSRWIVDDWPAGKIQEEARAFRGVCRSR